MSISFSHSLRILRNDRLIPLTLGLAMASLIALGWLGWLVAARIPLTVDCVPQGGPTREGALIVSCTSGQFGQLALGQAVQIALSGSEQRVAGEVWRLAGRYERGLAENQAAIYLYDPQQLATNPASSATIIVGEKSPLQLLLAGQRAP